MLTFSYKDYRVDIDDAGNANYWHFDDMDDEPSMSNNLAREIVLLTGQILQLVMTDTLRAEMAVAGVKEDLRVATNDVESAARSEYEARIAGDSAKRAQSELAGRLNKAEDVLQTAKAKESC